MPRALVALALASVTLGCSATNDTPSIESSATATAGRKTDTTTISTDNSRTGDTVAKRRVRGENEIAWPWGPNDTLYDEAIDGRYRLLVAREMDNLSETVRVRVRLSELLGAGRTWDIVLLPADAFAYGVLRADSTSIVLSRTDTDRGTTASLKLFLDPGSKKVTKQVEFSSNVAFDSIPEQVLATALGVPDSLIRTLKERDPDPGPNEPWDKYLPQPLKDHRMPSSSYADFAQARPARVKDGYGPDSDIGEVPGAFQIEGSRIWFGKTFYDGEGSSGVGGVGYFDTASSTYTFLKLPEIAPWSVSSLLVDDETLWIGLVDHPEGPDYGGGLLRHDRKPGTTKKFSINDVILRIRRWNGRTYVATSSGATVVEGDSIVARYMAEPDLGGKFVLVRMKL